MTHKPPKQYPDGLISFGRRIEGDLLERMIYSLNTLNYYCEIVLIGEDHDLEEHIAIEYWSKGKSE